MTPSEHLYIKNLEFLRTVLQCLLEVIPAGFSGAADPKGPVAGYDPVMKFDGRKKGVKKYINNLLKNREKREKKKQLKKLQNFNPYFNQ